MRSRLAHFTAWLAAVMVFAVASVVPAWAQDDFGRRLALVIGNSGYQNAQPLKNAANDARMVAETLTDLGFEVTLLTDAFLPEMRDAVARIKEEGKDAEAVLFYYSGHGFQLDGSNFLVPTEAKLRDRKKIAAETIQLNELIAELADPTRKTMILIDACRDSPLPPNVRGDDAVKGLAQVSANVRNTYVLFSTGPGNVSADGIGDNGPFALALQENLPIPDQDFLATMKRVRQSVEQRTNNFQLPWAQDSMIDDFKFNIGLSSGILVADLGGGTPGDVQPFNGVPPAGSSEDVASLSGSLIIDDIPENLARGTQVEGTGPAIPDVPKTPAPPEVVKTPDPAPTSTTTVATLEPLKPIEELPTRPGIDTGSVDTTTPPIDVKPPEPEFTEVQLAELVQAQLKRVGCYTSVVDGDWGKGSEKALKKYFDAKAVPPTGNLPSLEIKAMLEGESATVCKVEEQPVAPKKPVVADKDAPSPPKTPKTPKAPVETKKPVGGGLSIKAGSGSFR